MHARLNELNEYYSKRAGEYEAIYHRPDPIRQREQTQIGHTIARSLRGRSVLELACGTGYWTKYLLNSATKIIASDISLPMLAIASKRYASTASIQFLVGDAYNPPRSVPPFTGAMALCWFSHIPKRKVQQFLSRLHSRLGLQAYVLFVDNVYRPDSGGTLVVKKGSRDTWKQRTLQSGERFDVLKNYYTGEQLSRLFSPYATKIDIQYLTHFWIVGYIYNGYKRGI